MGATGKTGSLTTGKACCVCSDDAWQASNASAKTANAKTLFFVFINTPVIGF
jgi:hypothetical protein